MTERLRISATDAQSAWRAVRRRDPRYDGRFVYAVSTTGIYCRPTCPSRRPKRDNVLFFPNVAAAEECGFRACLRCQPREPRISRAASSVSRAREFLDAHPDETITLDRLAREVGMSPHHLQRTFKRIAGVSPKQYTSSRRVELLKTRLKEGDSVSRATYEAGYGSSSRVYDLADARLGMTPATYRRGGRGMSIRFAIVPSPLGRLLVGATERGICSVMFGDDDAHLEAELRREYPAASVERSDASMRKWIAPIASQLSGDGDTLQLPLDVQATAFQWKVWEALRRIPRGSTRSYGEIARTLGRPTASRAVARACASNRVALVIPCHRVVRGDGEAGGYRWGLERKRNLLAAERDGRKP